MLTTLNTPRINTNDDRVQVVGWHVTPGTYVEADQEIVDLETSKAVVTINAEIAGYINPLVKDRSVVRVGAPLYAIASTPEELTAAPAKSAPPAPPAVSPPRDVVVAPPAAKTVASPATPSSTQPAGSFGFTRFSPAAERLIQERGLSPDDFAGFGLVTARLLTEGKQKPAPIAVAPPPATSPGPVTPRSEPVSLGKQAEIDALTTGESGNINSSIVVYFLSAGIRARLQENQSFDGNIQPLILYELSRLLKKWPQFTAYHNNGEVYYYDRVDIGLAIDLGRGLKVVTIRDADRMMPIDIFEKTIDFGLRYMENRIAPEDLVGSTLTVTDLSGSNVLHFLPLINGHQSAILGLGGDEYQPGHPMTLCLTFDHRVATGREAATLLNELRDRLLSYAAPRHATAQLIDEAASSPLSLQIAAGGEQSCDVCGIDSSTYHRDFGRHARLFAYFQEDGSLGAACHRCASGFI